MDQIHDAAAALRALANDGSKVTKKMARLRKLMPEIEALQASGVTHEVILEALNNSGFDLKMGAYSTMLWRIRNKTNGPPKEATKSPIVDVSESPAKVINSPPLEAGNSDELISDALETQQRREAKADKFIGKQNTNPLLKIGRS